MKLLDDILSGEQSHTLAEHLSDEEIKHIEAMVTCEKGGQPAPPGKKWLYEVKCCFPWTLCSTTLHTFWGSGLSNKHDAH